MQGALARAAHELAQSHQQSVQSRSTLEHIVVKAREENESMVSKVELQAQAVVNNSEVHLHEQYVSHLSTQLELQQQFWYGEMEKNEATLRHQLREREEQLITEMEQRANTTH